MKLDAPGDSGDLQTVHRHTPMRWTVPKEAIDATRQDRRGFTAYEIRVEQVRVGGGRAVEEGAGEVRVGRLNRFGASADQLGAVSRRLTQPYLPERRYQAMNPGRGCP